MDKISKVKKNYRKRKQKPVKSTQRFSIKKKIILMDMQYKRYAENWTLTDIREWLMKPIADGGEGLSNDTAGRYIADMAHHIADHYKDQLEPMYFNNILRLENLYKEATNPRDKLYIMKELNEMLGFHKRTVNFKTDGQPIQINISQMEVPKTIDITPTQINIEEAIIDDKNNSND